VVIWTAASACGSRTPTERQRALERIPAKAQVIAAADGPALGSATFRKILDAVRPQLPSSLGCVVDAAMTSQAVAVGVHPDVGTTIVLITRAVVGNCPALSRIDEHVWAATIGAGTVAESRATSMLADSQWDRARPYLLREPFAIAAELPAVRVLAVAQPEPVDAWLAIDAVEAVATERDAKAFLAHYSAPPTIELASKLSVHRTGTQVAVNAEKLTADDLATVVVDLAERAGRAPAESPAVFTCPPQGNGVVSCHDDTHLRVSSVRDLIAELATVPAEPLAANGDIIGIRFTGDPPRLLRRDDVLLGLGSHRITDSKQLADLAASLDGKAVLAVRREGVEVVVDLSE
jgi:hypothetical protein